MQRAGGIGVSPWLGWLLAAAGLAAGYRAYGWPGVALAATIVVFWLLLQFSRALRALRTAGAAPVGSLRSAVMLHAKLRRGMTLPEVLAITGSLGEKMEMPSASPGESWRWRDAGGSAVTVHLRHGRVVDWSLVRQEGAG